MSKTTKKSGKNIGILGYGEIGKAIAQFYKKPRIKDLERNDRLEGVEVLHICIPWSNNFVKISRNEIEQINPKLTIIHSTVAPETTKKVISLLPIELKMVVHSPIRGIHPYLHEGIKTFVKYIGADEKKAGNLAKNHLDSLEIKTRVFSSSVVTEIGKLLDTSYYGVCIAWHGEMKKICDEHNIDFKEAVTDFNETYNIGYAKLGKSNVVRPVLYPPQNGIGGHCIISNAEILKKCFKSRALDLILKYDSRNKK